MQGCLCGCIFWKPQFSLSIPTIKYLMILAYDCLYDFSVVNISVYFGSSVYFNNEVTLVLNMPAPFDFNVSVKDDSK